MNRENLTIGALSAQTDCNVPTIRYYEQIGLLPHAERGNNGRRYYRQADLNRLTFIKRCRDFGFPIEQVRGLVKLFEDGDRSCADVRDMAQQHLDAVRIRLEEMRQLEASMVAFVTSCSDACSGGMTKDCVIISDLASPSSQDARSSCGSVSSAPADPAPAMNNFSEIKRKH